MIHQRRPEKGPKALAVVLLGLVFAGPGCGSEGEVEIEAPIPVHNPSNTGAMSGIDETNEAQHQDKLKGSLAR